MVEKTPKAFYGLPIHPHSNVPRLLSLELTGDLVHPWENQKVIEVPVGHVEQIEDSSLL